MAGMEGAGVGEGQSAFLGQGQKVPLAPLAWPLPIHSFIPPYIPWVMAVARPGARQAGAGHGARPRTDGWTAGDEGYVGA